jgi:cob(I)alamin adenosyltransferase
MVTECQGAAHPDHARLTARRRVGHERKQARATRQKGLLMVFTGPGKGKTTAAFGMALRAVGHGMRVGVVQFIKGGQDSAEKLVLSRFENMDFQVIGDGFTWLTQNRVQDMATAERAWAEAERMIADPRYDLVILDELNLVLNYGYLDPGRVLAVFSNRRSELHIAVTGRNAPAALVELADLVSEIRAIKHPYREQGVKAQKGIEF